MASGRFSSSLCTAAGKGYYRYIEVIWSSSNNTTDNKSTISWTAYSRSPDTSTTSYVYAKNVKVTINGTTTTLIGDTSQKLFKDKALENGSITVTHGSDGAKSVSVAITAQIYNGETNSTYSGSITMTKNPVYTLSISAGNGSSVTVNRTSCAGVGSTGSLSAGIKKLCKGDVLKITASANTNYTLSTLTVNSSNFTPGNSYSVGGNVSVASTAQVLSSGIGATNADIGSTSTITVTKYDTTYYHSLQYSFGSLSGYITANGSTSSTEVKFSQSSVAFSVPTAFYDQIPNTQTGVCTITCRTYSSSLSTTQLGDSMICTFTATASQGACSPTVNGTVIDTNTITKALTGNNTKLIRYKSTAECTISATAKNSATISSASINGESPTSNKRTFADVSTSSFVFAATDSRGYSNSRTVSPTIIPYIILTCNPVITRPNPTGSSIVMTFSGDLYRGSFGAYSNALTLKYRYRQTDGTYGSWTSWTTISSGITYGTNSYSSTSAISLGNSFDYQKSYEFQVQASDGASNYELTTVTKIITVQQGLPVFDWGQSDFNFNVDVNVNGDIKHNHTSIFQEIDGKEDTSNRISAINSSNPSNSKYPSETAVVNYVGNSNQDTGWIEVTNYGSTDISKASASVSSDATFVDLGHNGAGIYYRIVGGNHVYVCANVKISSITSAEKYIATLPANIKPSKIAYSISACYGKYIIRSHVGYGKYSDANNNEVYETRLYVDWVRDLANLGTTPTSIDWCDIYIDYFI